MADGKVEHLHPRETELEAGSTHSGAVPSASRPCDRHRLTAIERAVHVPLIVTDRAGHLSGQPRSETALRELNETLEQQATERTSELPASEPYLQQFKKMATVGQLTGGLAHDLNNMLNIVSGNLELLEAHLTEREGGDLKRYLTAAQTASQRAAALTHRLLAFCRRETLGRKSIDVSHLISSMEELIRRTIGPAITVEIVLGADLWNVLVDANQLENAVLNLCINARDAMPHGGRLTIEIINRWLDRAILSDPALPRGPYLALCISDSGMGMTSDVIEHAFDPFFTTKPYGKGTGLGLSMVNGFARETGGQARIFSRPGQGTTVCLYLPRDRGGADVPEAPAEPAHVGHGGRSETVLVVDDEPAMLEFVVEVLEELGYGVLEATDGPAALKVLRSSPNIDLLIGDIGLPGGMDGRQMADAARRIRPDLKVLFITGYTEDLSVGGGQLEPGMSVLTKPFAITALVQSIRHLMSEATVSS